MNINPVKAAYSVNNFNLYIYKLNIHDFFLKL